MGLLEQHAQDHPEAIALIDGSLRRTWQQWNERATTLANALAQRGVGRGSGVAVHARNRAEWLDTSFALSKIGANVVSVNPRLAVPEIRYILDNSGAAALVSDQGALCAAATSWRVAGGGPLLVIGIEAAADHPGVAEFEAFVAAGDPTPRAAISGPMGASLLYTSGTTGAPKGAIRNPPADPAELAEFMRDIMSRFGMRPGERHLLVCPLAHAAPPIYAQMTHLVGGTVIIMARFDAERVLEMIEAEAVTSTFLVPTMLNRLVNLPDHVRGRADHTSLRTIVTGGSTCNAVLKRRVAGSFGQVLFDLYGATESGLQTMLEPSDQLTHADSVGRVLPGNALRFLDESGNDVAAGQPGEIWARGPMQMDRYHDNPEATAAAVKDGWVTAGDIGYVDGDGYVYILDRVKDVVISGGVNIYPAEIEAVLAKHPSVFDSAVVGVPHEDWGEALLAIVQPHVGSSVVEAELEEFCRSELAAFKCPRQWKFVAELPRNHIGKVLKKELRAPYWSSRPANV
ncbi:MAG: fatty-acyl-CoA synthase [Pseudonocardiales bacterium]|jgi:acyl-CoA synthetase (AMP-forming)/AMP-acid ligase II|nr:fatty-acyl-CoA synthase [Pseudonocardiales bacterium]